MKLLMPASGERSKNLILLSNNLEQTAQMRILYGPIRICAEEFIIANHFP